MNTPGIIEAAVATLEIHSGILHITLKQDADIDVEHVEELIKMRVKLQGGKPYPVLADIRKLWLVSKKARERAAQKEMTDLNVAMAILTSSLTSRMLANFFIRINRPSTPTRMFTSKEEALTWLRQQIAINTTCLKLQDQAPQVGS
ncbi:MAG: STAS/SEC14 domain-containing protein [Flavobacteriales bacterium]|nr:STAS/SEC14 domain-containing protein [Flavobacteriales bacterium]